MMSTLVATVRHTGSKSLILDLNPEFNCHTHDPNLWPLVETVDHVVTTFRDPRSAADSWSCRYRSWHRERANWYSQWMNWAELVRNYRHVTVIPMQDLKHHSGARANGKPLIEIPERDIIWAELLVNEVGW